MSIGINWKEIWLDAWKPVWRQGVVPPVTPATDTTDGFGTKTEELVHEVGTKPPKPQKKALPPSILTPRVRKPERPESEKPTRKRKAKKEPSIEVQELQVSLQFVADPQISLAPVLECCVSLSFHADPYFSIEPGMEFLDDAVAIAIGHPELAQAIGDFLPVPRFDNLQFMGNAL